MDVKNPLIPNKLYTNDTLHNNNDKPDFSLSSLVVSCAMSGADNPRTTNISMKNSVGSAATLLLLHLSCINPSSSSNYGVVELGFWTNVENGTSTESMQMNYSTDNDRWRLFVWSSSGAMYYNNKAPDWKSCDLKDEDNGKHLTYSVDESTFRLEQLSGACTDDMVAGRAWAGNLTNLVLENAGGRALFVFGIVFERSTGAVVFVHASVDSLATTTSVMIPASSDMTVSVWAVDVEPTDHQSSDGKSVHQHVYRWRHLADQYDLPVDCHRMSPSDTLKVTLGPSGGKISGMPDKDVELIAVDHPSSVAMIYKSS